MLLITENIDKDCLDIICEEKENKKTYKIKGPFLQSQIENKNKRIYSRELIEREIKRYTEERIKSKSSLGEMDHPLNPSINLDRVSHMIESLEMVNDNAMGVARILETPKGKIAETLLESGVRLGISSRGVGTLSGKNVNDDYHLITCDLVSEASGPDCYVRGVLENKEYIIDGNKIVEKAVEELEDNLAKHGSREILSDLQKFLRDIKW